MKEIIAQSIMNLMDEHQRLYTLLMGSHNPHGQLVGILIPLGEAIARARQLVARLNTEEHHVHER